jgi:hypothetical protein
MHTLHLFNLFTLASAKLYLSYDASAKDPASVLGQQNLQGWDRAAWPSHQKQNASAFFTTATDPNGVPAAHVHKDAHFIRSEYHMMVKKTAAEQTYYIGYHVSFGTGVDYKSCPIVFQWCVHECAILNVLMTAGPTPTGRITMPIPSAPTIFLFNLPSRRVLLPTGT